MARRLRVDLGGPPKGVTTSAPRLLDVKFEGL